MNQSPTQSIGKRMSFIAWIIGILLLTQMFSVWERKQEQPNLSLQSHVDGNRASVVLASNKRGHYRSPGLINGSAADFVVDTGATDVVIPQSLQQRFGLSDLGDGLGLTANGYVSLQKTVIEELSIGPITLYNVRASLNPAMPAEQPILLGMSALGQLDIEQSQGVMTLSQYR